jgi:hypothetical protein
VVHLCKVDCKHRLANHRSLIAKIKAEMPRCLRLLMVNFNKLSSFHIES